MLRWLAVLLIAVAAVAAWLYFNPDERRRLLADTPLAPTAATTTLYKWRDDQGGTHITDRPPHDREYEELRYRGDANLLPATPVGEDD